MYLNNNINKNKIDIIQDNQDIKKVYIDKQSYINYFF